MSICVGVRDTSRRSYCVCIFTRGIPICRLSRLSDFYNTVFRLAFFTSMIQHDSVSRAASRMTRIAILSSLQSCRGLAPSPELGASGCEVRMFDILSSDHLNGVCVSESTRKCMAIVMEMFGNCSRSGAHDVCRWYQAIEMQKQMTLLERSFSCQMLLTLRGLPNTVDSFG